jgi:hypothetical protein
MTAFRPCRGWHGQFYPFAAIPDSGAQKQRAQVLLNGARADVELARNFLVAASLDQQIQHLLVAGGNFDLFQIHHASLLLLEITLASLLARPSPILRGSWGRG